MRLLEVKGSAYEMGKATGQAFATYLNSRKEEYTEKYQRDGVKEKIAYLENKMKEEFPDCLDEIYGRADGAKIDRNVVLLMFCPEIYKRIDGCTTVLMKDKDGDMLFSHNEDDVQYNNDNIALIKYNYGDHWIVGYTNALKLTGSSFSYNSYGLVFSSNYVYDVKIELDYVSRYVAVREALQAKTVSEAISILKNMKVASAFSLNILDRNTNEAVNVEKDCEEIYVTHITDRYARSNHFIAKPFELEVPKTSVARYLIPKAFVSKLDPMTVKMQDLIDILNTELPDYYETVFKDPKKYTDKSVTVANFSYDNHHKRIRIQDYLSDTILEYGYDEFPM